MLKKRIIPVLSFNGFALIKTKQFLNPRMVGNPTQAARVYDSRNVDELIFVDIFATKQKRKINLAVVKQVIDQCFMPVTIGGGITSVTDITNLLQIGADKVVLKTIALENPAFITEASKIFGAQCIVVSVDVVKVDGTYVIYDPVNNKNISAIDFITQVEELGAGEIFINDVDADGMMNGMSEDLFSELAAATNLPVIACGGVSKPDDFLPVLKSENITGLAASSIFHFTQYTPFDIKYAMAKAGYPVRLFDEHLAEGINL